MNTTTVDAVCLTCTKPFQAPKREVKRGNGKYCSRTCSANRPNVPIEHEHNLSCSWCSATFYISEKKQVRSKSGLFFCCREHKELAQSLKGGFEAIQPDHYGLAGKHNYRTRALAHMPNVCSVCSFDRVPEILIVHHKDHDRKNNELSNLEILCPNCHNEHHFVTKSGNWSHLALRSPN